MYKKISSQSFHSLFSCVTWTEEGWVKKWLELAWKEEGGSKSYFLLWVIPFERCHTEHYQKISTSNLYRNTIIFLFLPWEPICDFKRGRNIQVTQKSFTQDRNFTLGCFYAMATCNMPLKNSKKESVTKTGNHDEIKLNL